MTRQKWFEVAFLLILIAVVFVCGSFTQIKSAVLTAVFLIALTLNIIRLVRAADFRRELKANRNINCSAVIKLAFSPTGSLNVFSTGHALAEYSVNGKAVRGWMMGLYEGKLKPGDSRNVIVNKSIPTMFAFSEKQVSTAVMNYAVFTAISAILAAGCGGVLFLEIFGA